MTSLQQLAATTPGLPCATTDPELWFSPLAADRQYAARACHTCPILAACLRHAPNERWGVWGGVDTENRQTRRAQQAA